MESQIFFEQNNINVSWYPNREKINTFWIFSWKIRESSRGYEFSHIA